MFEVNGTGVAHVLSRLAYMQGDAHGSNPVQGGQRAIVRGHIAEMRVVFDQMGLDASFAKADEIEGALIHRPQYSNDEMRMDLGELGSRVKAELMSVMLLCVEPARLEAYSQTQPPFGQEVAK